MTEITLVFNDQEYRVSDAQSWGLIEAVESVVSIFELLPAVQSGQPPMAKVCRAYAAALSYAGAGNVTPEQVRAGVDMAKMITMAGELAAILMLAFPEQEIKNAAATAEGDPVGDDAKKKPVASKKAK